MENVPQIPEDDAGRRQFWQTHIDAWRGTELSQREYARRNSLPIARFTYWKGKLYPAERSSGFVELKVKSSAPVRIHHRTGAVIECLPGTDVGWLKALLGIDDAS